MAEPTQMATEERVILLATDGESEVPSAGRGLSKSRLASAAAACLIGAACVVAISSHTWRVVTSPASTHAADFLELDGGTQPPKDGREPITFYVYRAQSVDAYPLENVNAADLAGVMWYLHNEVVVSTPRKYKIDRIRRFKLTLKNTEEFWNVHHRNFAAFVAFDAARCTTPICGEAFSQYGFIVGCQIIPTHVAPYLGDYMTRVDGACKGKFCNAPVWYSLPGPCPLEGFHNEDISGNAGSQNVMKAKSASCLKEQPGGLCDSAAGAPDCTYSYEPAGEILLDELVGIDNYDVFWNASYARCEKDRRDGLRNESCVHNKEFVLDMDKGIGCSFWDGKADEHQAATRMKAVKDLFKLHYPDQPYDLVEPACDFDAYYDGETEWPTNHSNAVPPSRGFSWSKAKNMRKTTTSPPHVEAKVVSTCQKLGCGARNSQCACTSECRDYHNCCEDYASLCQVHGSGPPEKAQSVQTTTTTSRPAGPEAKSLRKTTETTTTAKSVQTTTTSRPVLAKSVQTTTTTSPDDGEDAAWFKAEILREMNTTLRPARVEAKSTSTPSTTSRPAAGSTGKSVRGTTTTTTLHPVGAKAMVASSCKEIGCGARNSNCGCISTCRAYGDCCGDFDAQCQDQGSGRADENASAEEQSRECLAAKQSCHKAVAWAVRFGIAEHPDWYEGLSANSTSDQFQSFLTKHRWEGGDTLCSEFATQCRVDEHILAEEKRKACLADKQSCDKAVAWALRVGIHQKPEWYEGLSVDSTEAEFQKLLAKTKREGCDNMCSDLSELRVLQ